MQEVGPDERVFVAIVELVDAGVGGIAELAPDERMGARRIVAIDAMAAPKLSMERWSIVERTRPCREPRDSHRRRARRRGRRIDGATPVL
ncbi:hypothetical protein D3C83_31990 [compost metagenome]